MNQDGTDKCFMEKLVDDVEEPGKAFILFKEFFKDKI